MSDHSMRITIDMDASNSKEIQKATGLKKKSPALDQALSEFLRMQQKERLIQRALSGATDFSLTNDELESRDAHFETARKFAGERLQVEQV